MRQYCPGSPEAEPQRSLKGTKHLELGEKT
jgi:hypothetical protein